MDVYISFIDIWPNWEAIKMSCKKMDKWLADHGGGRGEYVEHRGCLGHWTCSIWYHNDGHMALYICQNP